MTKARYERLCKAEGEKELCALIRNTLDAKSQMLKGKYNSMPANDERNQIYWDALALDHAVLYVEDWINSL